MNDIAGVLVEHQPTSKLLSPHDVRVACLCGRFAQDDELPTYHNAWIMAHQAAALTAAGFGPVQAARAEAWDEGFDRGFYDPLAGSARDASESLATNPYRKATHAND